MRIAVAPEWMRYVFAKGYIAINGASLTIATTDREAGWFEVWLIPETLRLTTFADKRVGDRLNIEIERSTQVMVDTVRDSVREMLQAQLADLVAEQLAASRAGQPGRT
jgi:riboflavin synthase